MTNDDLIQSAEKVLRPYKSADGRVHGDVGAAVLSKNGDVYNGVCVDTASWGLCAERSALAAMITAGECTFQKIVAVWRDDKTEKIHVLPPCGVCREFMRRIDEDNMEADVILGRDKTVKLKDLIPFHEWPEAVN